MGLVPEFFGKVLNRVGSKEPQAVSTGSFSTGSASEINVGDSAEFDSSTKDTATGMAVMSGAFPGTVLKPPEKTSPSAEKKPAA